MSLQELEQAIRQLPAAELSEFARWFEEYLADAWDRRIEADIQAGRLNAAGDQADHDFDAIRLTLQELEAGHPQRTLAAIARREQALTQRSWRCLDGAAALFTYIREHLDDSALGMPPGSTPFQRTAP